MIIRLSQAYSSTGIVLNVLFVLGLCGSVATAAAEGMKDPENFWAFNSPTTQVIPEVRNEGLGTNTIDRFIVAKLEANKLEPSPEASKAELIRRATLDLLGMPPTPEEVESFLANDSSDAYEKLIDRLLANPHYGEKWGQLWLDVIRYSESEGFEYDRHLSGAWRFRDYVIRSFNEDKPFDKFITEQIAGDEFENPTEDQWIAAGFHRFGPVRRNAGNPEIALSRNEVLTERTDIIGSAFLGVTMGCARCHDHKLDPVSLKDYYSLQAFMAGTQEYNHFLAPQEMIDEWNLNTKAIKEEIAVLEEKLEKGLATDETAIKTKIGDLKSQLLSQLPTVLSIKNDPEKRTKVRILDRGIWEFKGELVNMRPPDIINRVQPVEFAADYDKPRTALAEWVTDPKNPLTSRVLANRIWLNHFSNGLVNTPNDFGFNGERPSHLELLDYLALELVNNGWRQKPLHKEIMMSKTYRQSSRTLATEHAHNIDPANRLLWKFNRRRLQAEEIRDSLLAVSGRLNTQMYGESIMLPVEKELIQLLYKPDQWQVPKDPKQLDRRSVYLIAKRNLRLPFMETFDQPTLQSSCGRRESSTHPPQALELLNGDISNDLAQSFADRLTAEQHDTQEALVDRAWKLIAGRKPTQKEADLSVRFLQNQPLREFTLAMFNVNDFLYVY